MGRLLLSTLLLACMVLHASAGGNSTWGGRRRLFSAAAKPAGADECLYGGGGLIAVWGLDGTPKVRTYIRTYMHCQHCGIQAPGSARSLARLCYLNSPP